MNTTVNDMVFMVPALNTYFHTHLIRKYLTKYASDLIKPFDGKTLFDKALPTKCTRSACLNSLMPLAKPHPIDMILDKNFHYFAWITKLQMKHVWNSLQSKEFWHFHEFKNSWFYKKNFGTFRIHETIRGVWNTSYFKFILAIVEIEFSSSFFNGIFIRSIYLRKLKFNISQK